MNELEDRWFWAYPTESVDCDGITGSANEVYSKSDVDKVIAEKDKEIAELEERIADGDKDFEMVNNQNERLIKTVLHHKHKRCLAMAQVLEHVCPITNRKAKWMDKWHKRWLELSEKFKDKETK